MTTALLAQKSKVFHPPHPTLRRQVVGEVIKLVVGDVVSAVVRYLGGGDVLEQVVSEVVGLVVGDVVSAFISSF